MNKVLTMLKMVVISWIAFAITAAGDHGMVLCFGADGHFALEMSQHKHCEDMNDAQGHERQDAAERLESSHADCCSSCIDVPLSSEPLLLSMSGGKVLTPPTGQMTQAVSAASFDAKSAIGCSLNARHVLRCARLRTAPFLLALQTIVLRV